ncbi:Sugar or nucleoside kinase, ribokinase family [Actinopolymorpha cephalotaxi]|uniref:Sugar or nucleoside kinase, ribokinase family n=1 Tax=Actinopolymorpha cephalotaxi TaxID=504797 RepID=A0A1I2Z3F2_9ACTN|nr:carbohydrate kinase family protein [Actinopolymorpha cephalotaxi]NYH81843.1 sugar/nucleoside kinase (ribokinase family) [Actinopolymorpha cephalotaxi]SFH32438.1 Sugar or nucleoside kinase, ribokinase family [Actinopolymorpha cephalotaxi]
MRSDSPTSGRTSDVVGCDVVVCGPASWNHIVRVAELPEPRPHMVVADGDVETLGGTSAGKALHLVDLGRSVTLHTVLGSDDHAERIRTALTAAGVPLRVRRVPGASERHLNLMDSHGGRLSIYLDLPKVPGGGPPDGGCPDPGLRAQLAGARAVVLDLSEHSRDLIDVVRATNVPIWTDLHDYDGSAAFQRPFAAAASYVFMNADKLDDPLALLHALVADGARIAVCTLGAQGAVAVDDRHDVHRVPAAPVATVVDTNGAGDAFMAGFLHAHLAGSPAPRALRAGAEQAVRALTTVHLSPLLERPTS